MDAETRGLLRIAGRAYRAEMEGEFCTCDQPEFCGRTSRLCFACGLVNQQRIKDIDAAMNGPHYYEPMYDGEPICNLCFRGEDDPRHAPARRGDSGGA